MGLYLSLLKLQISYLLINDIQQFQKTSHRSFKNKADKNTVYTDICNKR